MSLSSCWSLSERSHVSKKALQCRRWNQKSVNDWLTDSVTRSPIKLSWTAEHTQLCSAILDVTPAFGIMVFHILGYWGKLFPKCAIASIAASFFSLTELWWLSGRNSHIKQCTCLDNNILSHLWDDIWVTVIWQRVRTVFSLTMASPTRLQLLNMKLPLSYWTPPSKIVTPGGGGGKLPKNAYHVVPSCFCPNIAMALTLPLNNTPFFTYS